MPAKRYDPPTKKQMETLVAMAFGELHEETIPVRGYNRTVIRDGRLDVTSRVRALCVKRYVRRDIINQRYAVSSAGYKLLATHPDYA